MSRRDYHREYYQKNIHKRRRQRVESKKRCQWKAEEIHVGIPAAEVNQLMRLWV